MSEMKALPAAAEIVKRPEAFGLTISREDVATKGKTYPNAPIVVIEDVTRFLDTFGPQGHAVIQAALDSSSVRVQAQGIARRKLSKNPTYDRGKLAVEIVDSVLLGRVVRVGGRTRVVEKVTVTYGGATYESEVEAAQAALVDLVDSGQTPEVARAIVKRMFPGAFTEAEEVEAEEEAEEAEA